MCICVIFLSRMYSNLTNTPGKSDISIENLITFWYAITFTEFQCQNVYLKLTCKSTNSASFKEPRAGVSPVVLKVVIFNLTVPVLLAVEGIPADPHTDVRRHSLTASDYLFNYPSSEISFNS